MRYLVPALTTLALTLAACNGCPGPGSDADTDWPDGVDSIDEWLELRAEPVDDPTDLEPLIDDAADHPLVLLGEATHGTKQFYEWRADFTVALARDHGLDFIAVEADWDSALAADRWVTDRTKPGDDHPSNVEDVLVDNFDRWGEDWMYANDHFAELLERLRDHNREADDPVRVYGMDMHGFFDSLERLVERLENDHPDESASVVDELQCLAEFSDDANRYSRHVRAGRDCRDETEAALRAVRRLYDGDSPQEVSARKHARVVAAGEAKYRNRVDGPPGAFWNERATHMAETVEALLDVHGDDARGAVWAHNTHVGDARATDMPDQNRVNIGQIARESLGEDAVWALGFSSAAGEVLAASDYGHPPRVMDLPRAADGSVDDLLARHDLSRYAVRFRDEDQNIPVWHRRPGHRAVGVVYHPDREDPGNYVPTNPAQRYEAMMFIEQTSPLRPL